MRIAFLCKRRYMSKDVVADRYARLYEIPRQLSLLGHDVLGLCLDYHGNSDGEWTHDGGAGHLHWRSRAIRPWIAPRLLTYPRTLLSELRAFTPDVFIGASDIPHVAMGAWLAERLRCGYVADLYDNFEGFGQARIPGFVPLLRWGVRKADLVTTTSEMLGDFVRATCPPRGEILPMPSSVDLQVFFPRDRSVSRKALGLPLNAKLVGTAGGLYREKGVEPLYSAWRDTLKKREDLHLVLAGAVDTSMPPPDGARVHYLGQLPHDKVALLFNALDIGVISVLNSPFGRYCFPQKAYEMLACGLPVVAADVGATGQLFAGHPHFLFRPSDSHALAAAVLRQLQAPTTADKLPIKDWSAQVGAIATRLPSICARLESYRQGIP